MKLIAHHNIDMYTLINTLILKVEIKIKIFKITVQIIYFFLIKKICWYQNMNNIVSDN